MKKWAFTETMVHAKSVKITVINAKFRLVECRNVLNALIISISMIIQILNALHVKVRNSLNKT